MVVFLFSLAFRSSANSGQSSGCIEIIFPLFEQPDFSPGEWITHEGSLPYFDYTIKVIDFIETLSGNGFIQPFDWMIWREGERLVDHPELLRRANLQTLRKLLTAHVRVDRFSEGHLAAMFESGPIAMILKRLA